MIVDSTIFRWYTSPSSLYAPLKEQKGIWTCMIGVMTPTSAGCTPQMTLALDLSLVDVEGCQPCRNTRPGESSVPCTPEKGRLDGGKSYETPDGRGIIEARFARKSSWELFTAQPNYSQNMAVDAQSVVLPCFTYDSLSHATLRYLLPQNCACELSRKRYTLT